jgi:hypothetical protein
MNTYCYKLVKFLLLGLESLKIFVSFGELRNQ